MCTFEPADFAGADLPFELKPAHPAFEPKKLALLVLLPHPPVNVDACCFELVPNVECHAAASLLGTFDHDDDHADFLAQNHNCHKHAGLTSPGNSIVLDNDCDSCKDQSGY